MARATTWYLDGCFRATVGDLDLEVKQHDDGTWEARCSSTWSDVKRAGCVDERDARKEAVAREVIEEMRKAVDALEGGGA